MHKVLCFGSLNIDNVYSVSHFLRPGETLASLSYECFVGGKGLNQAIALSRAGTRVYLSGAIGPDGNVLLAFLDENQVDTSLVRVKPEYATGHTIIQKDKTGQNCILLVPGANKSITDNEIETALIPFGQGDFLVLQYEINNIALLMEKAKAKGMKIVFNPSPFEPTIKTLPLGLVDYFILNEVEGFDLTNEREYEKIMRRLSVSYSQASILLTVGKLGAYYKAKDTTTILHHGIYPTEVIDTTGAGDTFLGYFIAEIIKGKEPAQALEKASMASSLAVSCPGAAPSIPTSSEVEHFSWLQQ